MVINFSHSWKIHFAKWYDFEERRKKKTQTLTFTFFWWFRIIQATCTCIAHHFPGFCRRQKYKGLLCHCLRHTFLSGSSSKIQNISPLTMSAIYHLSVQIVFAFGTICRDWENSSITMMQCSSMALCFGKTNNTTFKEQNASYQKSGHGHLQISLWTVSLRYYFYRGVAAKATVHQYWRNSFWAEIRQMVLW